MNKFKDGHWFDALNYAMGGRGGGKSYQHTKQSNNSFCKPGIKIDNVFHVPASQLVNQQFNSISGRERTPHTDGQFYLLEPEKKIEQCFDVSEAIIEH